MTRTFLKMTSLAAVIAIAVSCKDNQNEVDATDAETEAMASEAAVTYNVDTEASTINWVGSKPTADHTGTIALSDGSVMVNGETVEGGEFTVDMTSIKVTDLEGESAMSLKSHLEGTAEGKQTDFFNTPEYPTAKFVVTGLNGNTLEGNLTLKDVTKNVSFPVTVSYDGDKMMLTSEEFTIDRTDWGIKYGSSNFTDIVADKAISDDIKLKVNLVATK
ncbi:YceI family protein [Nonlabens marinus]|uniref:Rhodanese-like domain protein n=1 Tax=Nonlabens marinus S1-08 TaxID=1454201 RepID=W8VZ62_9FLAO|nr:YceI family protein [Nonlabens marinus]BAO54021.1 rhodanese-like domain protein [Nonlabens marinus S1-08]